ncbi:MAG: DNA polymerase [bacterium]
MKGQKDKKRLVLLDMHGILHRAYHALPDFSTKAGEPTGALYGLVSILLKAVSDLKPDYIVAAYDLAGPTHRHEVYEDYKAHRAKTDDALVAQFGRSRDVLRAFNIPWYEAPGFEADDVIGTVTEEMKQHDVDVVIASGDMDMLQLIDDERVRVFTFKKGLSETILYDEAAIVERFGFGPHAIPDLKGIMGDASDNIKGVPGVGEGSAMKLLGTFGSIEKIYQAIEKEGVEAVAKQSGIQKRFAELVANHEKDALFSRELATIRRDAPINFSLPEREWRESLETDKVFALLSELEFRALVGRVKALLQPGLLLEEDAAEHAQVEAVDPRELQKIALAVWVLDSNISSPDLDDVYNAGKSRVFEEARKNILEQIQENSLGFVYEKIELPLAPVLRTMETWGVTIDTDFLKQLSETYSAELKKIAARIYEAAGGEFNINSPKQLGEVLFDRLLLVPKNQKKTATGQRSTRESELEKMRDLHPAIADILAHRELQKLLSTYIDTIPTLLDDHKKLHTTYIQTGTTTGRVASKDPNLQNIPIKTELGRAIRHAFVASEGMELVSFDYSQIELRIAALLSEDDALTEIFKNGRDVHAEVAARVFGVAQDNVTYEQRRRAKIINFGILYGMGVSALRESLGTSRAEAQEFFNQYFAAFPRLASYLEGVKQDAARLGYTETLFGRRRYFEGIQSTIPFVRASAERMAINAPIQGTSADINKLAMVAMGAWIEKEKLDDTVHLLLHVHDELVFEVTEEKVATYAPKVREIMEGIVSRQKSRGIPFTVEGKRGKNWGDMHELKL